MNYILDRFFMKMGLVSLVLLALGFAPFVVDRIDKTGDYPAVLALHGLVMVLWYVLFTYQASLVGKNNIQKHMALGQLSPYVVAAFVVTGLMVTNASYDSGSNGGTPLSPSHFIILPLGDMAMFLTCFLLAYKNRKTPATHKRYMWLASLLILDPAVVRFGMSMGAPPVGIGIIVLLLMLLVIYDKKTLGHVHKATKVGLGLWLAYVASVLTIGPSQAWADFVHMLFG